MLRTGLLSMIIARRIAADAIGTPLLLAQVGILAHTFSIVGFAPQHLLAQDGQKVPNERVECSELAGVHHASILLK